MDNLNKTGAVRSADSDLFSYTSLPMLGLMGVARTAVEGKTKYGRLNYKQGMPVHQYIDHAIHHLVKYTAGDRSEPNLEHAAWGLLAAIESAILHPELNAPHDLGPGSTITPAIQAHLDSIRDDLADRRRAGEFKEIGKWRLADLPDVQDLLRERERMTLAGKQFSDPEDEELTAEMVEFLRTGALDYDSNQPLSKSAENALRDQFERAFRVGAHDETMDESSIRERLVMRLNERDRAREIEAKMKAECRNREAASEGILPADLDETISDEAKLAAGWGPPSEEELQRDIDYQARADASHAEWVAEKGREYISEIHNDPAFSEL